MFNAKISVNNWKSFYTSYPGKDSANKHLTAIRKMTSFGMQAQDCFAMLAKEQDLLILSFSQNKTELHIFHQPAVINGLTDEPTHHCIALLGMGPSASPAEVNVAFIQDIDIEMPTWVELKGVQGDAEAFLMQLKVAEEVVINEKLKGKSMIPIPLILAEAFFISPKKDPTSNGLTFLKAMSDRRNKKSLVRLSCMQFSFAGAQQASYYLPSPIVSQNPRLLQTGATFYTGMQSWHTLLIKLWT